VFDESNKPIGTKGFIASALVSRGPEREKVALVPSGGDTGGRSEKAGCRSRHHGHAEDGRGKIWAGQVQALEPPMIRRHPRRRSRASRRHGIMTDAH
jgi:hypothetical protein